MANTYTQNAGITLIEDGAETNTWGDITNTNLLIVDRLVNGIFDYTLSAATVTLSTSDGALSDGQYKLLNLTGTPAAPVEITIDPADAQKIYFVTNNCGQTVTFTQGTGGDVALSNGDSGIIYADGAGAGAQVQRFTFSLADFGLTASTAELNILDGVTATTAELNILDGVTATTSELNYVDVSTLGQSQASKAVTADANGVVTLNDGMNEGFTAVSSTSGSLTINLRQGSVFAITLTENVTSTTFSNPPSSGTACSFTLKVTQASTPRTITWPTSVRWAYGIPPTISAGSGDVDIYCFMTHDGGTNWYGFVAGQDFS